MHVHSDVIEPQLPQFISFFLSSSDLLIPVQFKEGVACVAWRFWLLSNKGGRGQRNREEIGAGANEKIFRARLDKTAMPRRLRNESLRVHSFEMIRIRISDTDDSSVHLIYHGPSDVGSLILIPIISKKRLDFVSCSKITTSSLRR